MVYIYYMYADKKYAVFLKKSFRVKRSSDFTLKMCVSV